MADFVFSGTKQPGTTKKQRLKQQRSGDFAFDANYTPDPNLDANNPKPAKKVAPAKAAPVVQKKNTSLFSKIGHGLKGVASAATQGEQKFSTGIARVLPGGTKDLDAESASSTADQQNAKRANDLLKAGKISKTKYKKLIKTTAEQANESSSEVTKTTKAMPTKKQIGFGAASTVADIATGGQYSSLVKGGRVLKGAKIAEADRAGEAALAAEKAAKATKAGKALVTVKRAGPAAAGVVAGNAAAGGLNAAAAGGDKNNVILNTAAGAALPEVLKAGGSLLAKTLSRTKAGKAAKVVEEAPKVVDAAPEAAAVPEPVINTIPKAELLKHAEKTAEQAPAPAEAIHPDVAAVDAPPKEPVATVTKPADRQNVISVTDQSGDTTHHELSGEALSQYKAARTKYDERVAALQKNPDKAFAEKQIKAEGMKLSAEKRRITGSYTPIERQNIIKKERSAYIGKKVEVKVNGESVEGTIDSAPSFGNVRVKLADGTTVSVKHMDLEDDLRTNQEILSRYKVLGSEAYKPKAATAEAERMTPIKKVLDEKKASLKETPKRTLSPTETAHMPAVGGYTHSTEMVKDYADMLRGQELSVKGGQRVSDGAGGYTRTSDHSPFYRAFHKENGRAPTRADYLEEAKRQLESGKDQFGAGADYKTLVKRESEPLPGAPAEANVPLKEPEGRLTQQPKAQEAAPDTKGLASRVYKRLSDEHPDELKDELKYTPIKLKEQAEKAAEIVSTDKNKAYRIAMGAEEAPEVTQTAVNIALSDKALEEGNVSLYSQLVKNRSLSQTRRGQEIVSEKGSVTDNSTSRYVKELFKTRLEKLGKGYLSDLKDPLKKNTPAKRGLTKLDSEVKIAEKQLKKVPGGKQLDLKEAQALIDKLAC